MFTDRLSFLSLWRAAACASVVAIIGVGTAQGQQPYPVKPIRLIVPAPAGSPPDTFSRWTAERLASALGQPVVVDNRVGAGGIIGVEALAKSTPDGYTIGFVHQGHFSFNPFLYSRTGYDPLNDFAPIARTTESHFVLAVHPDVKAASAADLVRLAKERPRELAFGSAPIGTPPHIADQLFRRLSGIETTLVPYKAGNFALMDLAAGRVHYTLDGIGVTMPHAKAGKVRVLAVTSKERLPFLRDVPTMAESGVPGYEYGSWGGFCAPTGVPREIVAKLNAELVKIVKAPDARDWLATQGSQPVGDSPEEFAALIRADHAKWGPIIKEAGIKLE